jgi:predicted RNase H-like HicB family nuclease
MADGETWDELYKEVKEHIDLWLEVNAERGFSMPEPTK